MKPDTFSWDFTDGLPDIPVKRIASYVIPFLAIISICLIFFWFFGAATPLAIVLAVALFAGLLAEDERAAAVLAGTGAFVGLLMAISSLTWLSLDNLVNELPAYAHRDIPIKLVYNVILDSALTNPILGTGDVLDNAIKAFAIAAVTAALAWGVVCIGRNSTARKALFVSGLVAMCLMMLFAIDQGSGALQSTLNTEPQLEAYAFDPFVYLKTYYNLKSGIPFIEAYKDGALGDMRVDKLRDWLPGPVSVRQPWLFYLWTKLSGGGAGIIRISLLFATVSVLLLAHGLSSNINKAWAFIGALSVLPYYFMGITWLNIIYVDWWAGMLVSAAFGLMLAGRYGWFLLVAVAAALSRETAALALATFTFSAMITRHWRRVCLGLASLAVFSGIFLWHLYSALPLFEGVRSAGVANFIIGFNTSSIMAVTSYLMFPYGWFIFPPICLYATGLIGSLTIKDKSSKITVFLFLIGFGLLALPTYMSSYWGQLFMPTTIVCSVLLFGWLDEKIAAKTGRMVEELPPK